MHKERKSNLPTCNPSKVVFICDLEVINGEYIKMKLNL